MSPPLRSPACLLKGDVRALVLSISDNHVNILVRDQKYSNGNRSLLKMSVVPTHKDELAAATLSTKRCTSVQELSDALIDDHASGKIIQFLSQLSFQLSSESGAEYSYYIATERLWSKIPLGFLSPKKAIFKVEMISPASDRQIERCLPAPAMSLIEETPEMYESVVKGHIDALVESGSLAWIQNIVDGTKEKERLLLNTYDFILNVDTKWKSHPDPLATKREDWYDHKAVADLYCLAIVKDGSIRSLRDLRGCHISMMKAILTQGRETLAKVYGMSASQLRVFVHYQPQFYHLHVHFTRLENEVGCQVERGHLLSDIIQNLEQDAEHYRKRVITYTLKTNSELCSLLKSKIA
jgi:m7GpppX diphosphatase